MLYFVIDEHMPKLQQRIATVLKPGGLVVIQGGGSGGTLDALLRAWSKWQPTNLRLLRLEYREGSSDWGGTGIGRLLLKSPRDPQRLTAMLMASSMLLVAPEKQTIGGYRDISAIRAF